MERQGKIRNLPFLTAMATAQQKYALSMKEDDFIEYAYPVWRTIGNIAPITRRFFTKVSDDFTVEIPQDCEFIRSITRIEGLERNTKYDSAGMQDRHLPSVQTRSNIPDENQSLKTSPGQSVNYTLEPGAIRITSADLLNVEILIIYDAILVDDSGLPLLNDKEVAAIAAEVTRRDTVSGAFQGIKTKESMLNYITVEADRYMAAAGIDEKISDDGIDKMLDIKTTWDRKVYGHRINIYK
ncbi:MAG: hypothetical protein KAS32_18890 [Candidatus Peribacteraceae bacterium]|nr:hypothetical protein [Candidatus Peribacteraceae bacterium]